MSAENFTVQYHFSSLAALADHIANKAVEKRASAANAKPKRKGELLAEAAAMESDAYLVRHSVIETGRAP